MAPSALPVHVSVLATVLLAGFALAPAGVATHSDGTYDQPTSKGWFVKEIDIYIIPPDHGQLVNGNGVLNGLDTDELDPCANSYVRALQDGIQMLRDGIQQYAAAWLANGLVLRDHVAGCDGAPTLPLNNPEIVVAFDENKAVVLGVAVYINPCTILLSQQLITSFSYEDMFSVGSHEVGHCLGMGHVNGDHPTEDLMNAFYEHPIGANSNPLKCVSNLNVRTIERAFAPAFGQSPSGGTASVSVGSYQIMNC